jgi:hypothetical protein
VMNNESGDVTESSCAATGNFHYKRASTGTSNFRILVRSSSVVGRIVTRP